jgi:NAD(P)H-dependent FMN reductase
MASRGRYIHAHTLRWSELVASFAGFVFVFPQYSWGYPAVLKNALDFPCDEWADKPAGSRHLRQHRICTPRCAFVSHEAGFCTGQTLLVNGGVNVRL